MIFSQSRKIYFKKILLITLFLTPLTFSVLAHEHHGEGDTVTIKNHSHDLISVFTEDGDNEFVCYNRVHRNFYSGTLITLIILLLLVRRQYAFKKKSSKKLQEKNDVIEAYNKDLVDSLHYAKRIQNALLPNSNEALKKLKDYFILYKPKDIVSGDFYWYIEKNNVLYIAVIDCTGHGVPGAFLSILGYNAINKAVNDMTNPQPNEILDKMNTIVKQYLKQDDNSGINDGMEIGLICIDYNNKKIQYAGAGRSLYWIHNNELKEIKASKHTVGATIVTYSQPPENHVFDFNEGDSFYLFTDGYADQFGGETAEMRKSGGKKLKYKTFKQLIFDNHRNPMQKQSEILDDFFNKWKNDLQQVDDVCVIGVHI